ncbi:penicillin acylase family protein [Marinimicrococcus flavescens]|uniref:Penicillin acylase family protein n=1 Tax=Marinimicrococcus flavescens TaxID=3031815 RepID=A0AAP3XQG1_9PROT|nr:penicillin acylase family protein [Marinimicrococcus flavescens]
MTDALRAADETIHTAGLQSPAEILLDRWGVPHLRAGSMGDLFFVQGFNAARDRLWQLDLWRKRGLGLLAGDLGPGFLEQDRASRLFLYRGCMEREWAAYGADTREICEAFTAGINAFIDLAEREPDRLPPEFALASTRPARWAPEDVVRIRSHARTRNALSELARARVMARADARTDLLRQNVEPRVTPEPAPGIDLAAIPPEVLDLFALGTAGVTVTPERLAAPLEEAPRWRRVSAIGEVERAEVLEGSNNWAVHGSRTATGRPVLASDPHRAHGAPSLRYIVHLSAPGFDAIGAGEPVLPGISLGHNGTLAFGLTIFGADQEDLHVCETHPDDPLLYRHDGGWERMEQVIERIPVKGSPDQEVELRFTRHGPVLLEDREARRAWALRSVWFEPGASAYLASLGGMRARDIETYREAMRRWGVPSVNQVVADASGSIAWMPAGFVPNRPNWQGLLPVPGDGSHEWQGLRDPAELPCIVNPAEGFLATANELNLPGDWPHDERPVGFEWVEPSRADRIREVLSSQAGHDLPDSCALQTDVLSLPARRLMALLAALPAEAAPAPRALLAGWDCRLEAGSAAAVLFEIWWERHLRRGLIAAMVRDEALPALLGPGDVARALELLERPEAPLDAAGRDRLLAETLEAAWRECRERMGEDTGSWSWGRLHHGYFEHPLGALGGGEGLDTGPLPLGGSSSTPMHASYRGTDFRAIVGASFRMVVDVGDWDRSLCVNAPGQSGDPRSPHYRDLAPLWAEGGYVPMLYSRERVEEAAVRRILLEPA